MFLDSCLKCGGGWGFECRMSNRVQCLVESVCLDFFTAEFERNANEADHNKLPCLHARGITSND